MFFLQPCFLVGLAYYYLKRGMLQKKMGRLLCLRVWYTRPQVADLGIDEKYEGLSGG